MSNPYYKTPSSLPPLPLNSKPHPPNCKCNLCKILIPFDPTYVKPTDPNRDESGRFKKKPPRKIPVRHYYEEGVERSPEDVDDD